MGSFSPTEVKEFQSKVVFDSKLFDSFPNNKRKNLVDVFHMVEDKKNFIDLLSKMLAYLPSKRITAEQAMAHPFFKDSQQSLQESKDISAVEESDETLDIVVGKAFWFLCTDLRQ